MLCHFGLVLENWISNSNGPKGVSIDAVPDCQIRSYTNNRRFRPNRNCDFCIAQMQLIRVYNDHLTVIAGCRPALDCNFGIANRDDTEQQGARIPAIAATSGVSGNSLEVCHAKRAEVQRCTENERCLRVHL
jgi:hypothetical protein